MAAVLKQMPATVNHELGVCASDCLQTEIRTGNARKLMLRSEANSIGVSITAERPA
jgi:hypothetical protein